jgi:hypothetical protein
MTWNVKGKLSSLSDSQRLLRLFAGSDVLGFTEVGLRGGDATPNLPDFVCVSALPRPRRGVQGGVACYVKSHLVQHVHAVRAHADHGILWICLHLPGLRPLYCAVCYIPPSNSKIFAEAPNAVQAPVSLKGTFELLTADICEFGGRGDVLLMGDFNAHTRTDPDIDTDWEGWDALSAAGVEIPAHVHMLRAMSAHLPARRSPCARPVGAAGCHTLDMCRDLGLLILNGRLAGDNDSFTFSDGRGGRSVVDYFIASPGLAFAPDGQPHPDCYMRVPCIRTTTLPPVGGLQRFDHAPVFTRVLLAPAAQAARPAAAPAPLGEPCARFRLLPEHYEQYVAALLQPSVQAELQAMLQPDLSASQASAILEGTLTSVLHGLHAATGRVCVGQQRGAPQPGRPSNSWFNQECRDLRRAVRGLPAGSADHAHAHNRYKRAVRRAKRAFEDARMDGLVQSWYENPKRFWRSFAEPKGDSPMDDLSAWTGYFRQLYTANCSGLYFERSFDAHVAHYSHFFAPASDDAVGHAACLNEPVSPAEVEAALDMMQSHKAPGTDGIPAEALSKAVAGHGDQRRHVLAPFLAPLLTRVLHGQYPAGWGVGALAPVPKPKGNPGVRDDYRGIAVGSAIGKLYSLVLLARMDAWAERRGLRAAGQCGFRAGRGTTDDVFVLQHIVEVSKLQRKPLYAAFIDFRKAYDSVDRSLLWTVLAGMGVHGPILHSLQQMYDQASMRVRLHGQLGEAFDTTVGVRQGDPLSPLLFGLFIDRVEAWLNEQCPHGFKLQCGRLVRVLLYADDLCLVAETPQQLQALLDALHQFCSAHCLTVNINKSEVVAFNRGDASATFQFDGQLLTRSDHFVYLGVPFWPGKHISRVLGSNLGKARACMHSMLRRCYQLGIHNAKIQGNLFCSLVLPVLNYGCEVWGVYAALNMCQTPPPRAGSAAARPANWGDQGTAETFHRRFLKHLMGVRSSVSGAALLLECERAPVMHSWVSQAAGWWNRVMQRPDTDLVKVCLGESVARANKTWGAAWRQLMECLGGDLFEAVVAGGKVSVPTVRARLFDKWCAHVCADASPLAVSVRSVPDAQTDGFRLLTYLKWFYTKHSKGEGFIYHVNRQQQVQALARFRLGSHGLRIVMGRRLGGVRVPRQARVCPCCVTLEREDELHVLQCPAYWDIRRAFSDLFVGLPSVHVWNDNELRCFMNRGNCRHEWKRLADMLIAIFARRDNIIA